MGKKIGMKNKRQQALYGAQAGTTMKTNSGGGTLNKVVSFDLLRQMKKNGASRNAAGVGCYDRIIPPEAMLCCRR